MIKEQPLVSVCMITYGHEKYIQQSIESILMQQTTFAFELIIANDCSPDATDKVVKSIIKTHPEHIKYFSHQENKGMYQNFLFALNACKSKYVALCEGDDYWTDPLKLQKQVDFLENNPDYEVSFTNVKVINSQDETVKEQLIPSRRKTTFEQKHLPTWAPTLTRVFRNRDFSNAIPNVPGLDTIMLLYQSQYGKLNLLHEITGVYRLHDGGVYSSKTEAIRKEHVVLTDIECLRLIDISLFPKYFGLIFKKMIELKPLDKALFFKCKEKLNTCFNENKLSLPVGVKIKYKMAMILITLPLIEKSSFLQRISIKILNRFFIY